MKKITTFADLNYIIEPIFNRMIYNQLNNTHITKKALRVFFCTAICLSFGIFHIANAQTIVNSPLSYIGMGEMYPAETASNSMMGGIGISNSNGIYSNQMNSALLARNRYTVLEAGLNAELKNMQDYRQRQQILGGNYQSFNLTLPMSSRWTMSVGIRPHSNVNYETKSYRRLNVLGVDSLIYGYKGTGGVSKLSMSHGVRLGKEIYIGLESAYLFGTVSREVSTQNLSDGQYYKIQLENATRYSDFTFKAGLAYRHLIKNDIFLNVGATFDLSKQIGATNLRRFATLDLTGLNVINADTLEKESKFDQKIPVSQRFGISLERAARWMVGVDYSSTSWTSIDNNLGRSAKLPTTSTIAFGAEYTPDFESISSFFKRTTYRVGYSYATTPYDFAGNGRFAKDQFVSGGFAFPLRNFLNYINVSYQFGRRGLLADNALEEQYQRVVIGLTLGDAWFQKVKLN
ncbi:MAG: hypothetical protein RL127_123 [Bacteroidota bacterium]